MRTWQTTNVPCVSEAGPFFSGMSIGRSLQDRTIHGYDQFGREIWRMHPLHELQDFSAIAIQGHLLVLQAGSTIAAVDSTKLADNIAPLWVRDTSDRTLDSVKRSLVGHRRL